MNINHRYNVVPKKELRIVLIGKTGCGKSSTGNTLLGWSAFKEELSFSSVTSKTRYGISLRNRRKIMVVDTPGMLDTRYQNDPDNKRLNKSIMEILKCIVITSPGIHSLILVLSGTERFTEENAKVFKALFVLFGENLKKYLLIVFTRADEIARNKANIHDMVEAAPKFLKEIIHNYSQGYVVVDNTKESKTNVDATSIIRRIEDIVKRNGGEYYTNDGYEIGEKFLEDQGKTIDDIAIPQPINHKGRDIPTFILPGLEEEPSLEEETGLEINVSINNDPQVSDEEKTDAIRDQVVNDELNEDIKQTFMAKMKDRIMKFATIIKQLFTSMSTTNVNNTNSEANP